MGLRKNVLTTGEVAKICNVAPRTVSKWFDAGQLRGYRIPGSKDRRVPVDHLIRFMRAHGIPLNGLDTGRTRVVLLDRDDGLRDAVRKTLTEDRGYEVVTAGSALEAGAAVQQTRPHVLVADVTLPEVTPKDIVRFVRSLGNSEPLRLIGVAPGLNGGAGEALLQEGFDAYLSKPFDVRSLTELIENGEPRSTPHTVS